MYELYPYFTLDGSVGLYSPDADDIYHSTYGAAYEAYEKFIKPANFKKYFENNNEIKILDICFGIGYNTKIFLKYFFENIYIDTTHTDNNKYNYKIDTNNNKFKILIHGVDSDKILTNLSPFFDCCMKKVKNQKMIFKNERIEKIIQNNNQKNYYESYNSVILNLFQNLKNLRFQNNFTMTTLNIMLLNMIINSIDKDTEDILFDKKYSQFFDPKILALYSHIKNSAGIKSPLRALKSFLHNIYYKYISTSHKMAFKALRNVDLNFDIYNTDAREFIKQTKTKYNYIFLDGFSPDKCPCLWTLDFLKALYEHLHDNGIILTYTNSARVRNAMLNCGFKIYKIYSGSQKKFSGTLAIKTTGHSELITESDIIYQLTEYDLSLLKTKSGIFYRDENLNLDNDSILNRLKNDIEKSNLISVTQFKKSINKNLL